MNKTKRTMRVGIVLACLAAAISVVFASIATASPHSCAGGWTNCNYAYADGSTYASGAVGNVGTWTNYGYALMSNSTINSVTVRADFWATKTTGMLDVRVSNDGGSTWGPTHEVGGATKETTYNIDVTSDLSWTPANLRNLVVEGTCVKSGSGPNPTCKLDWIPVTVIYTI
jgi:hypothetical protein